MLPPPLPSPLLLLLLLLPEFGPQENHSFHLCSHFFPARAAQTFFGQKIMILTDRIFVFFFSLSILMFYVWKQYAIQYVDHCMRLYRHRCDAAPAATAPLTCRRHIIAQIFSFWLWINGRAIAKSKILSFRMARNDHERNVIKFRFLVRRRVIDKLQFLCRDVSPLT